MQHDETALLHPHFPEDRWTIADAHAADAEGWNIFEAHGYLEIERNDVNHPPYQDAPHWNSDDDAIDFVKAKAAEGSERHQRALAIHEKYDELIKEVAFSA